MSKTEEFRQEMIQELALLTEEVVNNAPSEKENIANDEEIKNEQELEEQTEASNEVGDVEPGEDETELESSEESLLEIDRLLSGHTKEFKDLVKSIKDPELQKKAIDAGKIARAREDRVASELGEVKKQYETVASFKQMLDTNPHNTILQIAKMANIDLRSLVDPTAADDEDSYLTAEERALNNKIKNIEQQNLALAKQLEAIELSKIQEEREIIDREINVFASDSEKYPYFNDLIGTIGQLLTIEKNINGIPRTSQERVSRLENAYKKALLLDDNLLKKRDEDLINRVEAKRKADVQKAKMLKKVSNTYANNQISPATVKDDLISEFKKMGL